MADRDSLDGYEVDERLPPPVSEKPPDPFLPFTGFPVRRIVVRLVMPAPTVGSDEVLGVVHSGQTGAAYCNALQRVRKPRNASTT